jgi:peptidoglycan/xylan/chitin deacetylase (PgdA/CDA1 family)
LKLQTVQHFFNTIVFFLILVLFLTACSHPSTKSIEGVNKSTSKNLQVGQDHKDAGDNEQLFNADPQKKGENTDSNHINEQQENHKIDFSVKPNELGQVMILMYHNVSDKESEWSRSYDNFKKDLQILYENGYCLIGLKDFIQGRIDVPAGKTPVIITFDDGLQGQFNYIEKQGKTIIDPHSAVGIINDFAEAHPDFGKKATFYIYYPLPFRQKEYIKEKLNYIVSNGMEIGNHTYTHANLTKLSSEKIQKELALNVKATQGYVEGYSVDSLALPYGASSKSTYNFLKQGSFEGTSYKNNAILLVGANPAFSPWDTRFDPYRLPRVRASSPYFEQWIKYFKENPGERFISDSNPDIITFPKELKKHFNEKVANKKVITY